MDGIEDALEQTMIDDHAPHMWMAMRDDRLPCDFAWFVRHSSLDYDTIAGSIAGIPYFSSRITIVPQPVLSLFPILALSGTVDNSTAGHVTSDFVTCRRFPHPANGVGIYLNLNSASYNGQPKEEVLSRRNVGLTGHVTLTTINGVEYFCVQYWQLYAFNDLDYGGPGNHEGDWNMYEQFIRATDYSIRAAVWYHHGEKTIEYLTGTRPTDFRPIGSDDDVHEVTSIPPHDDVYVGYNDHEFYRNVDPLLSAGGTDPELNYQTADIPNMGEILSPMPGFEILCRYPGYWGDDAWLTSLNPSPEGIMHNSGVIWQWPIETQVWVDPVWSGNGGYEAGTAGSPYSSLRDAAIVINSGVALQSGGRVIIVPTGSYYGPLRIEKSCRIIGRSDLR